MNGLVTIASSYSVAETIDRLVAAVTSRGLTLFARINHAENAAAQGLQLRPTELILFGNPKVGTALMQDKQTSGIDLPVKALAWQDEGGKVWLTYNDGQWLKERHNLGENSDSVLRAITDGMRLVTNESTIK